MINSSSFLNWNIVAFWASLVAVGKESACNVGDPVSTPRSRRSPGEGNGSPLQYSCLENSWTEELAGHSPWCCEELDTTKRVTHTHKL